MGSTDSKQRLGEKVIAARKKLEENKQMQSDRLQFFESKSPETVKVMIDSIAQSFKTCSPFLEQTLLIAWQSDPEKCQQIIVQSCKKVLSAPIIPDEYQWFQQYVMPSSIWFYKIDKHSFMFEELLNIVQNMSQEIISCMNSIYSLFQSHPKWKQLMNIKNETKIFRQDDNKVGLLKEKGITDILDLKEEKAEDMQTFIDSNLAVNILTTTAKQINKEFQHHMNSVMSHFGTVKDGPLKKVERCQSKLENDYQDAAFPKAAKLLDLIRCSVTFNTLDQLLDGYKGLMSHIKSNPSMVELARIKNGFLDPNYNGGYRDIKINVVYHSPVNIGTSMICEVQLLLLNYLHEKKRIHKLYSISRQELYFQMVVKADMSNNNKTSKDMKELQLMPVFELTKEVKMSDNSDTMFKCSVDTVDTNQRLIGMESAEWFSCMNMDSNEVIFEQKLNEGDWGRHSHHWIEVNNEKYLTVQTAHNLITMFKVLKRNNKFEFEENEALKICYGDKDTINFCEFDENFENIFIIINQNVFEQRSMNNLNKVIVNIKLHVPLEATDSKQFCLCSDGSMAVIGGNSKIVHIIDIAKKEQYELTSSAINYTRNPRFINGDTEFIAVSANKQKIEIWDIKKRKPVRVVDIGKNEYITSMTATNNILAVGGWDNILRLYDVRNWEMFYCEDVKVAGWSLHLTSDSKYLTVGGRADSEKDRTCVVLQIK